jgi:hypothetical protein
LSRAEWPGRWWWVAVFAIALATRLLWISVPLNADEGFWMRRGPAFLQAVLSGRPADTYLKPHPGVTNMWIIGSALAGGYLVHATPPADQLTHPPSSLDDYLGTVAALPVVPLSLYVQARIAAAFVTAACIAGIFALSWRLFGAMVALVAAAILLFEPFFLGYQRFVTTDANQANFTWLALLSFLVYLREVAQRQARSLRWSLLAGVFFGLALLSKVSAVLSFPAFALAVAWWAWRLRSRHAVLQLALGVLVFALAALVVAFLLWPALWADLQRTAIRFVDDLGLETGGHVQFFFGRTVERPGLAFYPVLLIYRLSPLLLLGTGLGAVSLVLPSLRRHLPDRTSLAIILLDLIIVLVLLSSVGSKLDRYIVPLIPGMALVAAAGISALRSRLAETYVGGGSRRSALRRLALSGPGVLLALVLLVQLAVLLPHVPYYVTYFNPLAGGPAVAQRLVMIGNGELMERAVAWLDRQAPPDDATVATWYIDSLAPYRGGPTIGLDDRSGGKPEIWRRANFVVLYVNMIQRNWPTQVVRYFTGQRPLWEVKAHGVTYLQVYPGPAVRDADVATIPNRVDLDFGDAARLIGYDLQTPETPDGGPITLVLYWQPLQPFPAPDFFVHLGIRDAEGGEWGGVNDLPVGGMLPVQEWEPGAVVRDAHRIAVPPGTPPGKYTLNVSLWSQSLASALDVTDGGAPAGRTPPLAGLAVTRAAGPPDLASDLQIANRLDGDVRVGPDAARLVGYEWPRPAAVRAGDAVPITLLWQAGAHEVPGVQLLLRLSQGDREWQRAAGHPLGGSYPPQQWASGQLVRDIWDALLPADVPSGLYQLELVARSAAGDQALLGLGSIEVVGRTRDFTSPTPRFSQPVALGDVAGLVGYTLPDEVRGGEVLPLTLYWRALGEADRSYTRFVHLLDANDRIVAQQDAAPGGDATPTTSWMAGEYVRDEIQIALPDGLPEGSYRVAVGLYDPASGRRLAAPNGEERILLSQAVHIR